LDQEPASVLLLFERQARDDHLVRPAEGATLAVADEQNVVAAAAGELIRSGTGGRDGLAAAGGQVEHA
jgi:hypothetical protein